MTTPILLVIAHPDDELITFGALTVHIMREHELHIVCITNPGIERIGPFIRFCNDHNIPNAVVGSPDLVDNNIHDVAIINSLSHYIQQHGIVQVYTHCPVTGDQGRHLHHQQTALMAGAAALNLGVPTYFLHYEGAPRVPVEQERNIDYQLTKQQYVDMIDLIDKYYVEEYASIVESGYPLLGHLRFYQMPDAKFLRYHAYYVCDHLNDWSAQAMFGSEDLVATATDHFEITKRKKLLSMIEASPVARHLADHTFLHVDIGSGNCETALQVHAILAQHTVGPSSLLCYDPQVASEVIPVGINFVATKDEEVRDSHVKLAREDGMLIVVSAFQVTQYLSDEEFEFYVEMADILLLDTYLSEERFTLVQNTFKTEHVDNRHHLAVRTNWPAQAPYLDQICYYYGNKEVVP